ncbi:MAG: peptidyl-prolyl cis-trans isomerase [Aquincola sp.]|nr:peptidyl-prolyl cis-trans isomerase [Aquincola sp.]MDH4289931.1 peptidyl-prolyl cis-trans isomerase [Aquincola sp.]MDH5331221.1 peptidyl-prolyl cis-trans isomerase [Aquincola sp.]
MKPSPQRVRLGALCLALWAGAAFAAETAAGATGPARAAPKADAVFAQVGDTTITLGDYQRALAVAVRNKFYHAKPPEGELAKFQREVGDDVVNRVLLAAEARRRGLKPDAAKIQATVAGYDNQYKSSPNWQANREKMLAAVVPQLERESLLDQLQRQVRDVPEPADAVARAFYEKHKDLFVEPEQVKLSVILLRVDAGAPVAQWRAADEEGKRLHAKLVAGADFAELAKLHSGDSSAPRGGQMEYTHRGMLPEAVQQVAEKLKVGALSEPVRLLEGVAILRLDGLKPAQQRRFDEVRGRAGDLWQRDEADARWQRLIGELRRATTVRIDESHYAPLRDPTGKPSAS